MPPNLLIKAAFVRGELEENFDKLDYKGKDGVRTNYILKNIYSYVIGERYSDISISAQNKKEEEVLKRIKETVRAFQLNYASTVKSLCSEIEVTEDTIDSVLQGVANELFCEGITWSRIIALFVFVGELTVLCLSKELRGCVVNIVYESFSILFKEKLQSWIDDHDGWECITSLSIVTQQQENSSKMSNPGWAKSLLYGTVRMIGTVAQIANYSNPVP